MKKSDRLVLLQKAEFTTLQAQKELEQWRHAKASTNTSFTSIGRPDSSALSHEAFQKVYDRMKEEYQAEIRAYQTQLQQQQELSIVNSSLQTTQQRTEKPKRPVKKTLNKARTKSRKLCAKRPKASEGYWKAKSEALNSQYKCYLLGLKEEVKSAKENCDPATAFHRISQLIDRQVTVLSDKF